MKERFLMEQNITLRVNAEALNCLQVAVDHLLEALDDSYEHEEDSVVRMALLTHIKQELARKKIV